MLTPSPLRCALVGILALPIVAVSQTSKAVDRPVLNSGAQWVYQVRDGWTNNETDKVTFTFERQDGDRLVFQRKAKASPEGVEFRSDLDLNTCEKKLSGNEEVCARVMQFPLVKGGQTSFEHFPFPNREGHVQSKCTTMEMESVNVPAGRFDAWRIECKGFWNYTAGQASSGALAQTYWYAPAVGRAVRFYSESRTSQGALNNKVISELVSYNQAAQ